MSSRFAKLLRVAPFVLLLAGAPAAFATDSQAPGARAPVVVELYTSQGCNACPPADAILAELARQAEVIALSLHVDYWDYIGWKDPFALPEITARQRAYARRLDRRTVYTPQMVVDGTYDVIGSRRQAVSNAIGMARARPSAVVVEIRRQPAAVRIAAGVAPAGGAAVWLLAYDAWRETQVGRGENAGRALANANVVRSYRRLGTWEGAALELPLDLAAARAAGRDGLAVIVQAGSAGGASGRASGGLGPVLGAAGLTLR